MSITDAFSSIGSVLGKGLLGLSSGGFFGLSDATNSFGGSAVSNLGNLLGSNLPSSLLELLRNFPNVDFSDNPNSANSLNSFINKLLFKSTGQPYYDSMLDFYQQGIDKGFFSSADDVKAESALDRAFQAEQADIERKWYENMSNTSYQRAVEDLQKAGLNPILGFSNLGSAGASSAHAALPSGSNGLRISASSFADFVSAGSNLMSSAGKLMGGIASMFA